MLLSTVVQAILSSPLPQISVDASLVDVKGSYASRCILLLLLLCVSPQHREQQEGGCSSRRERANCTKEPRSAPPAPRTFLGTRRAERGERERAEVEGQVLTSDPSAPSRRRGRDTTTTTTTTTTHRRDDMGQPPKEEDKLYYSSILQYTHVRKFLDMRKTFFCTSWIAR